MQNDSFETRPIGYVECRPQYRYEAPRQGVLAAGTEGVIRLNDDKDLLAGLQGLAGFDRIWVVFVLHLNETWNPMVQPPHEDMEKKGVFATRSPHRPNRIGMSCVELVQVDGNEIHIRNHDLLDRTPIVDIKPYLPYADAFPEAKAGWLDAVDETEYRISIEPAAQEKADWILAHAKLDVVNFVNVQLRFCPIDTEHKRIEPDGDGWVIAYRTWRIRYRVGEGGVTVTDIWSGYSAEDLADEQDRHGDKNVHRLFGKASGARL